MDNTLDSIRPSTVSENREELSYLFGRDPSIVAYGQRPHVSKNTQKNLYSLYDVEENHSIEDEASNNSDLQALQTVKVYLRMKPFPKKMKLSKEEQQAYQILGPTALYTKLPCLEQSMTFKRSNISDVVGRKYTFTKTFGPETTQLDLFEQAVKPQMIDFLGGQNSTIMTYGTTNSGKSYTLQGTPTSPGIIPRCLEFVFSNITAKSIPCYKPINHCDIVILDPLDRAQELEIKTKLLTFASVDKHQYINAYKEMQKLLQEESPIRPSQCTDAYYSVWVSFAEIYNETIYDLLSNECHKKQTPLKLAIDSQGRAVIKGLRTICVNSGSEAYQVLMAGQYNLKVAATALNARSSRSHCIFTIKLLKYYKENMPDQVEVSTFAFCDLAGSERLKKTLNIGARLREAQNINTSLLVLGRCLKSIHEGQLAKTKGEHIGPFRESKLTRLFQKALSGKEHMVLIVNINPLPNLYIETQNVLSFAAIAKKIVIEKEKPHKKTKSRFSQIVTQTIRSETDWDATEIENAAEWQNTEGEDVSSLSVHEDEYDQLLIENEQLKKENAALKSSALTRDLQIRQEMADNYTAMMKKLETEWKNRIRDVEELQQDEFEWSLKQVEDFYKQKIEYLNIRKRRRSQDPQSDNEDDAQEIMKLEEENSRLTSKVVSLKHNLKQLRESNETLTVEKNKATFELSLVREELKTVKELLDVAREDACADNELKQYVASLQEQLYAKQEQVKKLKVFLNEAKDEYIEITTQAREREYQLKEQEEQLFENEEKIEELESHLEHANLCLAEKIKALENLEEKNEAQTLKLTETEKKLQSAQAQLDDLNKMKDIANTVQNTESCRQPEIDNPIDDAKGQTDKEDSSDSRENVDERIISVETENCALKERLTEHLCEIQSLKSELNSAKDKLKDIAEQICQLQTPSVQRGANNVADSETQTFTAELVDTSSQTVVVELADAGYQTSVVESTDTPCQVDLPKNESISEQSSESPVKERVEELVQTSFIENSDEDYFIEEGAKLLVKYADLKDRYTLKCSRVDELTRNISGLESIINKISIDNITSNIVIEEYQTNIELLRREVETVKEAKEHVEKLLVSSAEVKDDYEKKIADNEILLSEIKEKLRLAEDHNECKEELESVKKSLEAHISKCKVEHEQKIIDLEKQIAVANEQCDMKSQCLDVHAAKILKLKHDLEGVTELQEKIADLSEKLAKTEAEKDRIQVLFDENNEKILDLEDRLEYAENKEREKDAEIITLQMEMKRMIQRTEVDQSDGIMETEVKNAIRNLNEVKERLEHKEEEVEQLKIRLQSHEQNAKHLDLLKQSAQIEIEKLRSINDGLKKSLAEKDHEMEVFVKNRDEMVAKYEALVKSQQEDLAAIEKQKKATSKRNVNRKEREVCENTSDDDAILKERRTGRRGRRHLSPPKPDEISVIDLSGSDSKRGATRTALAPPEPVTDKKKSTRKKKLFVQEDVSFQDIDPSEITETVTPTSQSRSLRSRRK